MSSYYNLLASKKRATFPPSLLLDLYPNAAVAYSLRKLRNAYSGSAIRVRRSVDNTEQDFGFDEINDTLTDWVGYNLWSYSEEIQQSVWIKEGTTVTENILTAPDGNNTADVVFETAVLIGHSLRRIRVVAVGEEYTVSFFVKANGRDFINVRAATQMSTDGVTQPTAWVDLSTGTVLSNSGSFRVAPTITSVGNDWYFIKFGTIASTSGTFTNFQVLTSPDGMNTNYIGDITKGVAIWGVQISNTSNVKPYQKTEINAGGNGFVTTWYDHSGSGRNGTQTTAGNQCQIVSNGSLIIDPSNGRLSTLWTNDRYTIGFFSLNANNLVSSVYVGNRVSGNIISFGSSNNQQANSFRWLSNNNLSSFGTATNGTSSLTGDFIAFTQRLGNSDVNMWINNVQQTSGISTINTGPNFFGNSDNTIFNNGYFQEGILWNGNDQSSNRTAIETNINNYYGIY
jgi:hypothetical protein